MKVGYNQVFGYYLEVTKANLASVPEDYIRKQTLANAERYITPELKKYEELIPGAEEKRAALEYKLFLDLRHQVLAQLPELKRLAEILAMLDVYAALAETAVQNHYVRPEIDDGKKIMIREGRHPVVERVLPRASLYRTIPYLTTVLTAYRSLPGRIWPENPPICGRSL